MSEKDPSPPAVERPALGRPGRALRIVATWLGIILIVAGTAYGEDDHFPFGPFRMYATADPGDRPVRSTRVEGYYADGTVVRLSNGSTGMRRAEIEGQLTRFKKHPELIGELAKAYKNRNPDRPEIVRIEIIQRLIYLKNNEPTGISEDMVYANWERVGSEQKTSNP